MHLNSKITAEPPFQHQGCYRNKALQTVSVWVRYLLTVKLFAVKLCMLREQTWFIQALLEGSDIKLQKVLIQADKTYLGEYFFINFFVTSFWFFSP